MRKFTSMIALLLTCTGAFAQLTAPTTKLSAEQLTSTESSQRVFLKATSKTNANWFTSQISSANISEKTLFVLKKTADNNYILQRLCDGDNGYIQPQEASLTLGAESSAQKLELLNVSRSSMTDPDLRGEEPYVRFKKIDKVMYLNVNNSASNAKFANGTGSWSVVNVYDASDYSFVTLTIQKEGQEQTETVKQVYKTGDKIVPPTYDGYAPVCQEDIFKTSSDDQTVTIEYVRKQDISVTLNPIEGNAVHIEGAHSIATFSAPFATTVPEGVFAYYANQLTETTAQLTKIQGNAIPANTGVILASASSSQNTVTMQPHTGEVANIENNALGHSAGKAKTLTGTFYILTKVGETVGFYKGKSGSTLGANKSYLTSNSGASVIKLVYNIVPTGIENIEDTNNTAAPIYDFSGRRVTKPVKGGLYIQNGKKVFMN